MTAPTGDGPVLGEPDHATDVDEQRGLDHAYPAEVTDGPGLVDYVEGVHDAPTPGAVL